MCKPDVPLSWPGARAGPVSAQEEALLLQFSAGSIQGLVQRLQLPRKVAMTALVLLRRFYLSRCVLEAEPSKFVLTAIYVACKVMYTIKTFHMMVMSALHYKPHWHQTFEKVDVMSSLFIGLGNFVCRQRSPTSQRRISVTL